MMFKSDIHSNLGTRILILVNCVLAYAFLMANVAFAQGESTIPRVEIPGSQLLHLASTIAGHEYDILVQLPGNYNDSSKSYPVIYVLDGQWDFPLVGSIYGQQYYDGFIPAAIVVGIAWGGPHPNFDSLRAMDLSPSVSKQVPQSGNGPKFLSFIKQELIPMIDAKYRTIKTDRTLMGSSFGGLFTLYALFQETKLFNRYVLTSPYTGWDNEIIDSFEKEYAEQRSNVPVRVFIAEGGLEGGVAGFNKYVDRLKSHHYSGLYLEARIVEGVGHSGAKAQGFTRGLQSVFERPSLSLAPAILDQYVGDYEFAPKVRLIVKRAKDRLVVEAPDNTILTLLAQSENDFYVLGQFLNVHFKKDEHGKVSGIQLERYGREDFVKRVD